jgi:RNA polymerase sigma factor (sigma-70 family)
MTVNDNELLRQYVREQSESAFAELVGRHIGLVYSAALRQLSSDRATAEDVAQAVFTDLARKAPLLLLHSSLTGWLYTSTRFHAAKSLRANQRRTNREHAAHAMNSILSDDSSQCDWETLRPLLDDAMEELSREDREMVLWRYFEKRPFAEIGLRLGLRENTARMRIERALDKLRAGLAKRGITSTAVALVATLAAHATEEVPASLTARVIGASSAAGAAGSFAWLLVSNEARVIIGAIGLATITAIVFSVHPATNVADTARAEPEGLSRIASQTVTTAGQRTDKDAVPVNTDLIAKNELRLSLLSAQDSRPIAQGEVLCTIETVSDSDNRRLRTDGNGEVRIPIAGDIVGIKLETRVEGFADTRLAWRQDRGEVIPHEYSLKLTPGVALGGSVVDENNTPINGVLLEVIAEESTTATRPECHVAAFNVKTDVAGRWRTRRIAPELVSGLMIRARHWDFAVARLEVSAEAGAEQKLRSESYTFHLDAVTTISGIVINVEGKPIDGANVLAGALYDPGKRTTRTHPDGSFSLAGYARGSVLLTAEAEGFAPTTIRVDSATGSAPAQLILGRGKVLSIRVLDRKGNPITNASVDVEPNQMTHENIGPQLPQTFRREARTDTNGVAIFPSLPDCDLEVGVSASGYIRQAGVEARAGAEVVVNLIGNLTVSGTVRDSATGVLVPKFRVRAGMPDKQGPYFSDIDRFVLNFAGGEFQHVYDEAVAMGENRGYLLRFEADGYEPFVSRLIAPDEGFAELKVNLRPASTRKLTVLNSDGSPAAWTDVGLLDLAKGNALALAPGGFERYHYQRTDGALQKTDATGVITLSSTDEVHWLAAANGAGYLETNVDDLADGASIHLQPWGRIEGVLPQPARDRANEEVWIQLIKPRLNAMLAGLSFHVAADPSGNFVLPRVPPGRMWVMFGVKNPTSTTTWTYGGARTREIQVRAGETVRVSFDTEDITAGKSALRE